MKYDRTYFRNLAYCKNLEQSIDCISKIYLEGIINKSSCFGKIEKDIRKNKDKWYLLPLQNYLFEIYCVPYYGRKQYTDEHINLSECLHWSLVLCCTKDKQSLDIIQYQGPIEDYFYFFDKSYLVSEDLSRILQKPSFQIIDFNIESFNNLRNTILARIRHKTNPTFYI